MHKARGIGWLPGGYRNYFDCIVKLLEKIERDSLSRSDFANWLESEYNLTSHLTSRWYVHTLLDLDLVVDSMNGLQLSAIGKEFLKTRKKEIIFVILIRNYAGIDDILHLLFRVKANLTKIHNEIEKKHSFGWKTNYQTRVRLKWLKGLGCIDSSGKEFFLTDEGRDFMLRFLSENEQYTQSENTE